MDASRSRLISIRNQQLITLLVATPYYDGCDGNVDKVQAAKHILIAAEKGHIQKLTSHVLALMERDIVQGKDLLQIAADAGDALALKSLQEMKQDESKGD
eukprot:scaffold5119_cov153-Skeletonema_dohrnii-CCMP3373.AAC.11